MEIKVKIYILSKSEQKKMTSYTLENFNSRNLGILVSLYTGIRIGELCALQWKDINIKKGIISINKTLQRVYMKENGIGISKIVISTPKTKNANRDIPLSSNLLQILIKLKNKDNFFEEISELEPDICLVALGIPNQEKIIFFSNAQRRNQEKLKIFF